MLNLREEHSNTRLKAEVLQNSREHMQQSVTCEKLH